MYVSYNDVNLFFEILVKLLPFYLIAAAGLFLDKKFHISQEFLAKLFFYILMPVVVFYGVLKVPLFSGDILLPLIYFMAAERVTNSRQQGEPGVTGTGRPTARDARTVLQYLISTPADIRGFAQSRPLLVTGRTAKADYPGIAGDLHRLTLELRRQSSENQPEQYVEMMKGDVIDNAVKTHTADTQLVLAEAAVNEPSPNVRRRAGSGLLDWKEKGSQGTTMDANTLMYLLGDRAVPAVLSGRGVPETGEVPTPNGQRETEEQRERKNGILDRLLASNTRITFTTVPEGMDSQLDTLLSGSEDPKMQRRAALAVAKLEMAVVEDRRQKEPLGAPKNSDQVIEKAVELLAGEVNDAAEERGREGTTQREAERLADDHPLVSITGEITRIGKDVQKGEAPTAEKYIDRYLSLRPPRPHDVAVDIHALDSLSETRPTVRSTDGSLISVPDLARTARVSYHGVEIGISDKARDLIRGKYGQYMEKKAKRAKGADKGLQAEQEAKRTRALARLDRQATEVVNFRVNN